jgi:hypothetical protein
MLTVPAVCFALLAAPLFHRAAHFKAANDAMKTPGVITVRREGYGKLMGGGIECVYDFRGLIRKQEGIRGGCTKGPRQHILPRLLLRRFASGVHGNRIFTSITRRWSLWSCLCRR